MMVRLEANKYSLILICLIRFQFHDGAIGSTYLCYPDFSVPTFQFHDGAIGRILTKIFLEDTTYFNSMMVRLEVSIKIKEIRGCSDFNSMMVRLEDFFNVIPFFKFHHFNSMMVRLEAG